MKLLIICDPLTAPEMQRCAEAYANQIRPDVVCFAPSYAGPAPLPGGFSAWTDIIGADARYNEIWFLGHGNIHQVGNLHCKAVAFLVNELKAENASCEVILVACGTADQNQQLLQQGGLLGFQAGTLVSNVASLVTDTVYVTGATVSVPMDPHAPLPFNPAQGQIVRTRGSAR